MSFGSLFDPQLYSVVSLLSYYRFQPQREEEALKATTKQQTELFSNDLVNIVEHLADIFFGSRVPAAPKWPTNQLFKDQTH